MPGSISDSHKGTPEGAPYIPTWCYKFGPRMCPCGHHEGYHDDKGVCLHTKNCGCPGLPADCLTPTEDL